MVIIIAVATAMIFAAAGDFGPPPPPPPPPAQSGGGSGAVGPIIPATAGYIQVGFSHEGTAYLRVKRVAGGLKFQELTPPWSLYAPWQLAMTQANGFNNEFRWRFLPGWFLPFSSKTKIFNKNGAPVLIKEIKNDSILAMEVRVDTSAHPWQVYATRIDLIR